MATNNKLLDSNALSAIKTYIDTGAIYSVMSASSVAGSTTSGSQKSVRWYVSNVDGIKTPVNGMKVIIKIPRVGTSTGVILSINGNTDSEYHPVLYNASLLTSHYAADVVKVLVYDSSASATVYVTAGTSKSITGCWKCEGDYDSNSYAYVRQYQFGANAAGTGTKYPILTRYNLTNKSSSYDTAYTRFYTDTYIDTSNGYLYAPKVYSNGNEVLTGITSSMVTTALGYTPYNSTNPNGYTSVTETTVSNWGFTKNAGTVTKVDSVSPSSGNVALSAVRYVSQTLTDAQKTQARTNIGAGTSSFTGYTSSNKLHTDYINNAAGWTSNTGTITGVSVNGTSVATSGVAALTNIAKTNADNSFSTAQTFKDINLYSASGDSPRLTFQRGTLTDTYNDWSLYDSSGYLYIQQRGSGSSAWETRATLDQSSADFVGTLKQGGKAVATQEWVTGKGYTTNTGTVIGSGLTAEYFTVGNGTVNIKTSSMRPSTSSTTWSTSSDVYVPTMKAISNYVTGLGYTKNTGTVTSVTIKAGTGLSSSSTAAITTSGERTISIASGYKLPTTTEWGNLATTSSVNSSIQTALTPTLVGYTTTSRIDIGSGSNGCAKFNIGTSNNAGIYIFTYGNCMVPIPIANLVTGTTYKISACLCSSGGSYENRVLSYMLNSSGTLYIWQNQNYIPTGYTAYLFKVKLYG